MSWAVTHKADTRALKKKGEINNISQNCTATWEAPRHSGDYLRQPIVLQAKAGWADLHHFSPVQAGCTIVYVSTRMMPRLTQYAVLSMCARSFKRLPPTAYYHEFKIAWRLQLPSLTCEQR